MKKYLLTMLAVLVGSNMWAQKFSTVGGGKMKARRWLLLQMVI